MLAIIKFYVILLVLLLSKPTDENAPLSFGESVLVGASYVIFALFFPLAIFLCFRIVAEFQRLVVFRVGRVR